MLHFLRVYGSNSKLKKILDFQMKVELGATKGIRSYYMVYITSKLHSQHLSWSLDMVCILPKTSYMSKKAFASLYSEERGVKVEWKTHFFKRTQLGDMNDKRRSPLAAKLSPYLVAISRHVINVFMPLVVSLVGATGGWILFQVMRQRSGRLREITWN